MPNINLLVFRLINGMAGHSWWSDSLFSLALANDLIKSAMIGACFFAAWFSGTTLQATLATRRTLLATLIASLLTLGTTAVLSHIVVSPRPYLQTHRIFRLHGNRLEELDRLPFRQPLDNRSQERTKAYQSGNILLGDLGSFPSDHAGFFFCLSLGIWLASRSIGRVALAWTAVVILLGKVLTGMHMPSEIAAGCVIATAWLSICVYCSRAWFENLGNRIAAWTNEHTSLAVAALFVALFEAASTLDHVKALIAAVGKHI